MIQNRRFLLVCILVLFVVITGLMAWNYIFTHNGFFQAGATPAFATAQEVPTLPPARTTDPARGATSTKALVVTEFSDFTCVYCRINETEMRKILAQYGDRIRIVWRDMPVHNDTPDSIMAAMAARCAGEQGRFWEMHEAIYDAADASYSTLTNLAHLVRIDYPRFQSCLTHATPLSSIEADEAIALQHHITSVPTVFIGDKPFVGLVSDGDLQSAIQSALLWQ